MHALHELLALALRLRGVVDAVEDGPAEPLVVERIARIAEQHEVARQQLAPPQVEDCGQDLLSGEICGTRGHTRLKAMPANLAAGANAPPSAPKITIEVSRSAETGEKRALVASLRLEVSDPSSSESEHSWWAGDAGVFSGGVVTDVRRRAAQLAVKGCAIRPSLRGVPRNSRLVNGG